MIIRIGLAVKSFNGFQKLTEESDVQTQILTRSDIENSDFPDSELDLIIWQPAFSQGKFPEGLVNYFRKNYKTALAIYNAEKKVIHLPVAIKERIVKEITQPISKHNIKLLLYNTAALNRAKSVLIADFEQGKEQIPLIGESDSVKQINDFVNVISKSQKTHCLIRGETGTEKEYIAKLIHFKSNEGKKPFHLINCRMVSNNDLFLHLNESLSNGKDKDSEQSGYLALTGGGTIVLDNIEAMNEEMQQKLLILLDTGIYRSDKTPGDLRNKARIIGMTDFDLETFVNHDHFSRDLYFRLKAFELNLTPLRSRKNDILLMVKYFIQQYNNKYNHHVEGLSGIVEQKILQYHWPGNVEELRLMMERAVLITRKGLVTLSALPVIGTDITNNNNDDIDDVLGNCSLQDIEKVHIKMVLSRTKGNKSKAAAILNISRTTLREKMRSFDLN